MQNCSIADPNEVEVPLTIATIVRVVPPSTTVGSGTLTADVHISGRLVRCPVSPLIATAGQLEPGRQVLMNENSTVVAVLGYEQSGELAPVQEVLDATRLVVGGRSGDDRVLRMSGALRKAKPRPRGPPRSTSKAAHVRRKPRAGPRSLSRVSGRRTARASSRAGLRC